MKWIFTALCALFIAMGFTGTYVIGQTDAAFAASGSGKEGDGRTEEDRAERGDNNDDRRVRDDGGVRDDDDDSRGRGRGRSGSGGSSDSADIVADTLELDDRDGSENSDETDDDDSSQTASADPRDQFLARDRFERF